MYYPRAQTKALISFAVTAKLICAFVFAYADCWFSHEAAQFLTNDIYAAVPSGTMQFPNKAISLINLVDSKTSYFSITLIAEIEISP